MEGALYGTFPPPPKSHDTFCPPPLRIPNLQGQRRIGYSQFERALSEIAGRRGSGLEDIRAMVAVVKTPTLHGTAAGAVRFHDDKSTYTGVHQHGGPEAVAKGRCVWKIAACRSISGQPEGPVIETRQPEIEVENVEIQVSEPEESPAMYRLFTLLFVRNVGRVCSHSWLSGRNSACGPF